VNAMGDQKWNKNALGYGEKGKAISQDQWNKEEVISFENDIKLENWINNNLLVK
jgi:hypothetical protein